MNMWILGKKYHRNKVCMEDITIADDNYVIAANSANRCSTYYYCMCEHTVEIKTTVTLQEHKQHVITENVATPAADLMYTDNLLQHTKLAALQKDNT